MKTFLISFIFVSFSLPAFSGNGPGNLVRYEALSEKCAVLEQKMENLKRRPVVSVNQFYKLEEKIEKCHLKAMKEYNRAVYGN